MTVLLMMVDRDVTAAGCLRQQSRLQVHKSLARSTERAEKMVYKQNTNINGLQSIYIYVLYIYIYTELQWLEH